MDTKVENYREHVEALSSMMINLLNDSESLQERILILCKYEKYKADFITFCKIKRWNNKLESLLKSKTV